jgi:hypothetical protein
MHCPTTHIYPTSLLHWWSPWKRSHCCFEASCIHSRWQMETFILGDLWLCPPFKTSIALVRSSSRCLRGDRNPTHRFHTPIWDSGTDWSRTISHVTPPFLSFNLTISIPYLSMEIRIPQHHLFHSFTTHFSKIPTSTPFFYRKLP